MANNLPIVLMILDGWGYREETAYNAIAQAHTPQWDKWWQTKPHMLLNASGKCVGLPHLQMGNSEVGHMHMGAGRVVSQDISRINQAISSGAYAKNPVLLNTINELKHTGHALHVLGLLSQGGVHSHEEHLFSLLQLCYQQEFNHVYLHLFLDGRDTPPKSALASIARLKHQLNQYPVATIASITGRYYAMDRDQRWQRVEPVYRLLTEARAEKTFPSAETAIGWYYQHGKSDEFIPATHIDGGKPIQDGDALFFFNYRADRARQLTQAFVAKDFPGFTRHTLPKLSSFISMTHYARFLDTQIAFPPQKLTNTLGEVLAQNGLRQLRVAETEKYAHVTFFLNGGSEQIFVNEQRVLIPSPKIATYDLQPEMSAPELTKTLVEAIKSQRYDVIICNYANADMVGHSGNFDATVSAIECLDKAMHDIGEALQTMGGQLLITSDHGNAESMFDETTHQAHTAHTNQPVPLLYVGQGWHFNTDIGNLIDIAPTLLKLLGITPPSEMTGKPLLVEDNAC